MEPPGKDYRAAGCRRLGLLLLLVLSAGTAAAASARHGPARADGIPPPLERRIRLEIWGGDLKAATESFTRQTGLTLLSWRAMRAATGEAPAYAAIPLYLDTGEIRAETALEMLARALGCRYRVQDDIVWLVDGYEWVDEPLLTQTVLAGRLLATGEDAAALERRLREAARAAALMDAADSGWEFSLRAYAAGGSATGYRLETRLPRTLDNYFTQALTALESPGEPIRPASPAAPPPEPPADAGPPVTVRWREAPPAEALSELSLQTGWRFGFDAAAFASAPPPPVTLEAARRPGAEVAAALAGELGLGRAERWVDDVVWLTPTARTWARTRPARRVLWEGLATRGFAAGEIAARLGGWEVLRARLRREAMPWVWDDPMTAMLHNPLTGVLVVRAPEAAVAAARAGLERLAGGRESR